MKKALIDTIGVLVAHGFVDFKPAAGQSVLDVSEDFNLIPGTARWDGMKWSAYTTPSTPRTLSDGELAAVLVRKGLLTQQEVISSD